jgi:hydrocephalus-inducing protein
LKITPVSGVVPAQGDLDIEVQFTPKFELTYNYNLTCNVKRKARPLVLNVKGEGYKIHHKIFSGEPRVEVPQPASGTATSPLDFGEFFINERKVRKVVLQNNGEFNFDFVWKRQVNKYVTIVPDTGTVQKGSEVEIELIYLPIAEHALKNYKCSLNSVSGAKYDFNLTGIARKPGVKLNATTFDFGQCFVTGQPSAITKYLEI